MVFSWHRIKYLLSLTHLHLILPLFSFQKFMHNLNGGLIHAFDDLMYNNIQVTFVYY
jgi:hypothetical protein